jgi:hypothetical protein
MGYLINNGSGFLKDAVQVASVRKAYLFVSGGYQGSTTEVGYKNFGTRVFDDGGTIESYDCISAELTRLQNIESVTGLLAFLLEDIPSSATIEAKSCLLASYNELTAIQIG